MADTERKRVQLSLSPPSEYLVSVVLFLLFLLACARGSLPLLPSSSLTSETANPESLDVLGSGI